MQKDLLDDSILEKDELSQGFTPSFFVKSTKSAFYLGLFVIILGVLITFFTLGLFLNPIGSFGLGIFLKYIIFTLLLFAYGTALLIYKREVEVVSKRNEIDLLKTSRILTAIAIIEASIALYSAAVSVVAIF